MDKPVVRISVRNLVEFILRSGDLDNRGGSSDREAMQKGSRLHRKIQGRMGSHYRAEVSLKYKTEYEDVSIQVEGRADGIFTEDGQCWIDEIKGVYADVSQLEKPVEVHRAQAMCYAWIYAQEQKLEKIGVQMTYGNLDTEELKFFREEYTLEELGLWYQNLLDRYHKWIAYQFAWKKERNASMSDLEFPFEYREGQRKIVSGVYHTISTERQIFVQAPTGVGKTELSLRLAENFHTSIVSADSRQLYAELKIGTAAPTPDQLKRVPHYLVGTLHLTDYYSAAQYEQEAMEILHQLFTEHEVVVLTGGSMMYVDAICKGIDDIPTVDAETRQVMLQKYEEEGLEQLCAELRLLDPDYYRIVDLKNPKRVIHALEICYMTGKTYTSFRTQQKKERPFRILKIGLTRDREELYDRINRRVDQMIEEGLLDEVRSVLSYRHLNSLNTVGYKELFKYLDGEWELPFAIEKIKQNSRIYSRKQMTWFKRDEEIRWFHPEQETEILEYLAQIIEPDH